MTGIVRPLIVWTFLASWSAAAPMQWTVESGGNGHWYELVPDYLTWAQAKDAAEKMSYQGLPGHLATLTSAPEDAFGRALVESESSPNWLEAWIGLTDNENSGGQESAGFGWPASKTHGWVWVTGEPFVYENWGAGAGYPPEPNDSAGNEDFAALWHNLLYQGLVSWNDASSTTQYRYLVEYESVPEPATWRLAAIVVVLLVLASISARLKAWHCRWQAHARLSRHHEHQRLAGGAAGAGCVAVQTHPTKVLP